MSQNQRQYFRCQHADVQSAAVLVVRSKSFSCQLIEMSLGGFAVVVPNSLPASEGSLARLQVKGLEYIVRVSRQEPRSEGVFVALEQLEEVLPNNSMIPATKFGRWLTGATWMIAVCSVIAALYYISAAHSVVSMSLQQ